VAALADPERTRLVLVARAQQATLREVARTHEELAAIGMRQQCIVINGLLADTAAANDREDGGGADVLATAIGRREQEALAAIPDVLKTLPTDRIALKPFNLVGLDAETVRARLAASGLAAEPDETLKAIAERYSTRPVEIAKILLAPAYRLPSAPVTPPSNRGPSP
jgi:arsenite-transporting ATPase